MSNKNVNTGFAKCFITFMAIVLWLQGAAYLGLAVWGITRDNCVTEAYDLTTDPLKFAVDLIYFQDKVCNDMVLNASEGTNSVSLAISIDYDKANASQRFFIFLIIYIVFGALWVITSTLVLATICGRVTKTVSATIIWPWFIVIIAGSIYDAVAFGFFISDITHTTSYKDAFAYAGATADVTAPWEILLNNIDSYFVIPAVIMTCISCRVILIWLLNVFGISFCLSLGNVLARNNAANKHNHIAAVAAAHNASNNNFNDSNNSPQLRVTTDEGVNPQPQQQFEQIPPKPLIIQSGPLEQQQQSPQITAQRSYDSPIVGVTAATYSASAPSPEIQQQQQLINRQISANNNVTTYRNSEAHPDRLNYPPQSPDEIRPTSPQQQLSVQSALNNRYSSNEILSYPSGNQGGGRVSAELRSQLPWSYTSMLTKPPPPPRKPQVQIYPNVPKPDYEEEEVVVNVKPQTSQEAYSRW